MKFVCSDFWGCRSWNVSFLCRCRNVEVGLFICCVGSISRYLIVGMFLYLGVFQMGACVGIFTFIFMFHLGVCRSWNFYFSLYVLYPGLYLSECFSLFSMYMQACESFNIFLLHVVPYWGLWFSFFPTRSLCGLMGAGMCILPYIFRLEGEWSLEDREPLIGGPLRRILWAENPGIQSFSSCSTCHYTVHTYRTTTVSRQIRQERQTNNEESKINRGKEY